jgi:GxxExxY protein
MIELLCKEESFKIIGIYMEIHKALGMGLKEINYKDAMEIEFIEQNIPYEREKRFDVKSNLCNKKITHDYSRSPN